MKKHLKWRVRRPGDTVRLRGLTRQVRKLMNEAAIPPALRDTLPLLCDEEGIVWIPFVGTRDGIARHSRTETASPEPSAPTLPLTATVTRRGTPFPFHDKDSMTEQG